MIGKGMDSRPASNTGQQFVDIPTNIPTADASQASPNARRVTSLRQSIEMLQKNNEDLIGSQLDQDQQLQGMMYDIYAVQQLNGNVASYPALNTSFNEAPAGSFGARN